MAAPVLNDYEYMYKDTGLLLNGAVALPFWDVLKVSGLDMPDYNANIDDVDSQQGGTVYALYSMVRTIIIEGMLYANPSTIESTIDTAIANFLPNNTDYPFYYKAPGLAQRYINGKAIKFLSDTETLRRTGLAAFQLQIACGDPRKYINNADQVMVAGTNYTPANPGNVETYPIITVVGAFTTITFTNVTTGKAITLTTTRIAGDVTVIDFKNKSVTINGIQNSSVVTGTAWWNIPAGGANSFNYAVTGGPPTSVTVATKQGWM